MSTTNEEIDYKKLAKLIAKDKKIKSIEDINGDNGILTKMFKPMIQEIINTEIDEYLGYEKHKSPAYKGKETKGKRNGTYTRHLRTSDGLAELEIPRDRDGNFKPKVIPPYKQITKGFEQKIISLYATGLSTQDIVAFIRETYSVELSQGYISKVTERIISLAKQWQTRALQSIYPIIYLDAIHIYCFDQTRQKVIKKAVYIVLGYDIEGKKDVLGFYISNGAEGAKYWLSVIQDIKNRGVNDVFISCVDGLSGFGEAINAIYPKAIVQRCVVHAIRNSLKYIPNKYSADFMEDLKAVYKADTRQEAEENLKNLENNWSKRYPMATNVWRDNWQELSQYFNWTKPIRKMIYTTNPIESFNSFIRKYTKNKRSFVSDDAMLKVLYLACQKATTKWGKSVANWPEVLNQFAIEFGDRLKV